MTAAHLRRYFARGLAISAPVLLTLAVLISAIAFIESMVGNLIRLVLPEGYYVPGMGLLLGMLALTAVGLLANRWYFRRLVEFAESQLDRIPVVKTLFKGMKDVSDLLTKRQKGDRGKAVSVELGGVYLIGFVMQSQARLSTGSEEDEPLVSVYLPMSYQIGGYILYVPKSRITPLEVSAEDAMRAVLTGGELHGQANVPEAPAVSVPMLGGKPIPVDAPAEKLGI